MPVALAEKQPAQRDALARRTQTGLAQLGAQLVNGTAVHEGAAAAGLAGEMAMAGT